MSEQRTGRVSAHERAGEEPAKGLTDFERLTAISDEEIATAAADDPDAAPLDIDWSQAAVVVPPRKTPVSIRLDEDVLAFFRSAGAGYQSRINAVLRSYVQARQRSDTSKG